MTAAEIVNEVLKWFLRDWWAYLLRPADNPRWSSDWRAVDWARRLRCRAAGHPCGCIYYNVCGFEPDGRCKDCGDYIA